MSEYTPTMGDLLAAYIQKRLGESPDVLDLATATRRAKIAVEAGDEFDRAIAQHDAEVLSRYVRNGVCLTCGDGVLACGEHIDPERHDAEVRAKALEDFASFIINPLHPGLDQYTLWEVAEQAKARAEEEKC